MTIIADLTHLDDLRYRYWRTPEMLWGDERLSRSWTERLVEMLKNLDKHEN